MSLGQQQFWFNYNNGSVQPNALISPWYNALAVKPSNTLLKALNNLSQGMDDDGNWTNTLDFFQVIAGMETDEQRLKPLYTSSGDDTIKVGTVTFDAQGALSDQATGYIDLKWNLTDAINASQNDFFIGSFPQTSPATSTVDLGIYIDDGFIFVAASVEHGIDPMFPNDDNLSGYANDDTINTFLNVPGSTTGYSSVYRTNGVQKTYYKNTLTQNDPVASLAGMNQDVFGCAAGLYDGLTTTPIVFAQSKQAAFIMGKASTANQVKIQQRLDAYKAEMGF